MRYWRSILLWAGLLMVLVVVNHGILRRERMLSAGRIVLLELAPADPRSLMQGDYMALRFAVVEDIRDASESPDCRHLRETNNAAALKCAGFDRDGGDAYGRKDGYVVLKLDADGIGRFVRVQAAPRPVGAGEVAVRYRKRPRGWWDVRIAGNTWFFPEGQAQRYAPAKYGELRVDDHGEALLTGLRDDRRAPL